MALTPCLGCGRLLSTLVKGRCRTCQLRRPRGNGWEPVRRHVLLRDSHRCQECGAPANVVDHVQSIRDGGSDHPTNLQALCTACNARKGDR